MFFPGILNDSKSLPVTRTLLSILADFNSAVVWIVSILPQISSSCSLIFRYTNSNWYPCQLHVPQCFSAVWQDPRKMILASFSHQHHLVALHWSLRDNRTLLNILADFCYAVVWSVWFFSLIFSYFSAPITNSITVTLMFYTFLGSQARSKNSSIFPFSLIFTLWSAKTAKLTRQVIFSLIGSMSGLLVGIRWSVCISNLQRIFMHLLLWDGSGLCHLVISSNFNFLHNSQWITFPIQSCLVLYFFCAS